MMELTQTRKYNPKDDVSSVLIDASSPLDIMTRFLGNTIALSMLDPAELLSKHINRLLFSDLSIESNLREHLLGVWPASSYVDAVVDECHDSLLYILKTVLDEQNDELINITGFKLRNGGDLMIHWVDP